MKIIFETGRLIIRKFNIDDADFILQLLNEPSFLQYIGDKYVRKHADAVQYLKNGPLLSYKEHGFGPYLVTLKASHIRIGMCGLLKRRELQYPDLGYAFLTDFCAQGYAFEAAKSILEYTMTSNSLHMALAITLPGNQSSIRLLSKLNFTSIGSVEIYGLQNKLYEYSK